MRLSDVPPGVLAYTRELVGDDANKREVREVFYWREPDGPCRYSYNVRIARVGIAQGDHYTDRPRYLRVDKPPCKDPGEADGRTLVSVDIQSSTWFHWMGIQYYDR